MALHRGIQSAIFYYASCAPCSEARVRKRRQQEAERDRADRFALEAQMPGLYRQAEPSSTNPFWQAEIDAGPVPMRTRKRQVESNRAASSRSGLASSVSVVPSDVSMERSDSAKSGLVKFQRQDEPLWGEKIYEDDLARVQSIESSSTDALPRQPPRAKINNTRDPRAYQALQNAAINDMHPPTTRKVGSKEEIMWMMQPPPLPEIMNGKLPTRALSSAGRSSTRSVHSRQSNAPSTMEEQEPPEVDDGLLHVPVISRSKTLPSQQQPKIVHPPHPGARTHTRNISRPQLSTVMSESMVKQRQSSENDEPQRSASFNADIRDFAAERSKCSYRDSMDEQGSEANTSPANFDAWQAPGFELPHWIHEHTKREVSKRWSFDM